MKSSVSPRLNAELLESNYARWREDPGDVDPAWSAFFEGFELGMSQIEEDLDEEEGEGDELDMGRRALIVSMVYNYRILGHTQAWLNPLADGGEKSDRLSLDSLGFSEEDLDREVQTRFFHRARRMPLREMIKLLEKTYCGRIGFEFMHIHNHDVRHWLRDRIEARLDGEPESLELKRQVLFWLVEAESFEKFLHRKYVGQKRFGLEGGESLMVALGTIFEACSEFEVKDIIMGMAHRGRLNVLCNFLRKPLGVILYEFSENYVPNVAMGDGDVKYHLGFHTMRKTRDGAEVGVHLAANPSHLEAVNSVVEGEARARQRSRNFPDDDGVDRSGVLPVLLHGDASFAGQGSVAEVLNLSQLPGYRTGGTVHIVVNNQVGFTTTPEDARSSSYCTDVAKMIEAPVFHVNGDDPLEVAFAAKLALEFRQTYHRDVVIDIVCYRRHGHNEGDEPAFTLPDLYRRIRTHPSVTKLFEQQLLENGDMTEDEIDELHREFDQRMEKEYEQLKEHQEKGDSHVFAGSTAVIQPRYEHGRVQTGISSEEFQKIGRTLVELPDGFQVNEKILKRFLEPRRQAIEDGGNINWAFAEALAFGSLLREGHGVRLTGQDSRRGTFSQRHAVLYDVETRERYFPLRHVGNEQGRFYVYNSLLSEFGVLGFEYGYSLGARDMLVLWEAQFGDFNNGAQVIIDQFIASAESKWAQPSSIVMLLPHGYEGMGPEHSNARPERFLQLCAEKNMQVCNLTKPAQYFHVLRRQLHRNVRKPLILMTPKSLLNHSGCVSKEADFTGDSCFREFLDDDQLIDGRHRVTRIVFCSGKVYYDLLKYRNENELNNVAIIRVEQLYPFDSDQLEEILKNYPRANKKWVWCQEEPENMGAWTNVRPRLQRLADRMSGVHVNLRYAGRPGSASTAAGSKAIHVREQKRLVEQAFSV